MKTIRSITDIDIDVGKHVVQGADGNLYIVTLADDPNGIWYPSADDGALGIKVSWADKYRFGDIHPDVEPVEYLRSLAVEAGLMNEDDEGEFRCGALLTLLIGSGEFVILPLYALNHGGITFSTKSFRDPWDSGQVGWVYTTRERADSCGSIWDEEKIRKVLEDEVEAYNRYLTTEAFVVAIDRVSEDPENPGRKVLEEVSACGRFVEDHILSYLIECLGEDALLIA